MTRSPNPEVRAVSGPSLHEVRWSAGFVLDDSAQVPDGAYSFWVGRERHGSPQPGSAAGELSYGDVVVTELAGWEWCGPVPLDPGDPAGPPSLLAVLTVEVDAVDTEHLAVVRRLLDQHQRRFGEARAWAAARASAELRRWIAAGCVTIPTVEELAAANTIVPTPPDKPRVERSGIGWAENGGASEPVGPEVSSETVLTDQELERREVARVAPAKLAKRSQPERSEPVPPGTTRADLRYQAVGGPGRPA